LECKAQPGQTRLPVALYVRNDNRRARLIKRIATCGPPDIDDLQPAITIMLPDEVNGQVRRASSARRFSSSFRDSTNPSLHDILSARKYPNPRNGSLTPAEIETRRLAHAITDPRSPSADLDTAARQMARLIRWLVAPKWNEGGRPSPFLIALSPGQHHPPKAFGAVRHYNLPAGDCSLG
jgi:hypothetical protein